MKKAIFAILALICVYGLIGPYPTAIFSFSNNNIEVLKIRPVIHTNTKAISKELYEAQIGFLVETVSGRLFGIASKSEDKGIVICHFAGACNLSHGYIPIALLATRLRRVISPESPDWKEKSAKFLADVRQ